MDILAELESMSKDYVPADIAIDEEKNIEDMHKVECFLNDDDCPDVFLKLLNVYQRTRLDTNIEVLQTKFLHCYLNEICNGISVYNMKASLQGDNQLTDNQKVPYVKILSYYQKDIEEFYNSYFDDMFKLLIHSDGVYLNLQDIFEQKDTLRYSLFLFQSLSMTKLDVIEALKYFIILYIQKVWVKL